MSIVSYSQNLEDVMLWRALKDVQNGVYVDIGANHPIEDSVTKAFYEQGWYGVNVEPEEEYFKLLEVDRPRDKNFNLAVTSTGKPIELYVSSIRGWSTTDGDTLETLESKSALVTKKKVSSITLDNLIEKAEITEIHFLKVDVEGAEKDVLQSFSFDKVRPWVVVVEATKPTTQIDASHTWEYILLEKNYSLVYFDGLNKFYVSHEKENLSQALITPPNVFDQYIRSDHRDTLVDNGRLTRKVEDLNSQLEKNLGEVVEISSTLSRVQSELSGVIRDNQALNESNARLQLELANIINSRVWRFFGPYRYVRRSISTLFSDIPREVKVQKIKQSLSFRVKKSNSWNRLFRAVFTRFPKLKEVYNNRLKPQPIIHNVSLSDGLLSNKPLNVREQRIYSELKLACLERRSDENTN
ncbi:hypothetical protein VCHA50P417_90043 [Vibrio chagasii]|nr:hypothetical protein VCHA35O142_60076 [Vibrio chagasii]CAH7414247.1 hypothetical protein VCHA50P417_90043 [Vibrio chagasii]CAH7428145.1 hypothetical protein VCHA48P442_80139 [Vibrio chagasii]